MAGCLGAARRKPPSPETLRRWQVSLSNVLATDAGKHIFEEFLRKKQLHEAIEAFTFWEMSHEMGHEADNTSKKSRNTQDNIFLRVDKMLKYADENNINLDYDTLKSINTAVKKKNYEETIKYLSTAERDIIRQLDIYHKEFKKTL